MGVCTEFINEEGLIQDFGRKIRVTVVFTSNLMPKCLAGNKDRME
jgi:hypothetical protein